MKRYVLLLGIAAFMFDGNLLAEEKNKPDSSKAASIREYETFMKALDKNKKESILIARDKFTRYLAKIRTMLRMGFAYSGKPILKWWKFVVTNSIKQKTRRIIRNY